MANPEKRSVCIKLEDIQSMSTLKSGLAGGKALPLAWA
jgi:hypothetical protein